MTHADESTAAPRRSYQLRWSGVVYIVITTLLGIGSINSQNNLLFIVFGASLGALLVSGVISGAMLMGVSVHRRPISDATVGGEVAAAYIVRNGGRLLPAIAIHIGETAVVALPSERARGAGDRVDLHAFAARIPPRRSVRVRAAARAPRRGRLVAERITVSTTFPLGVFRKSIQYRAPDAAIIAPAAVPCDRSAIVGRLDHRAPRHAAVSRQGHGDEFFSLRDYVPGDPPRLIAWKPSARTDQLVVRQHLAHADRSLDVTLLIDEPARSTDPDDPAERALATVLGLAEAAAAMGATAEVRIVPGDGPPSIVRGPDDARRLAAILADLDTLDPDTAPAPPRHGLVVRTSDPRIPASA